MKTKMKVDKAWILSLHNAILDPKAKVDPEIRQAADRANRMFPGHRDPKRIDGILGLIKKEWIKQPDQRFGQLLINFGICPDTCEFFNIEDDVTEAKLAKPVYQRWYAKKQPWDKVGMFKMVSSEEARKRK